MKTRNPLDFVWPVTPALLLAMAAAAALMVAVACSGQEEERTAPLGYTDTPRLPGQKWKVHDIDRPRPRVVTSAACGQAPSDAIVLFDGKDLSRWVQLKNGKPAEPRWKVENGYVEVVGGTGDLVTKEKFGDMQLHVEWASPAKPLGTSQWRGNSGIVVMSRYEVQVLDSYENPTYADGQAASIYGQWPPLVNASRKPGEWQSYDIVFEAPKFEGKRLVKPAHFTVFHNGVLVHHRQAAIGQMAHREIRAYEAHGPDEPLSLQDHDVPVRYRNIWIRRLKGYDEQ